MLRGNHDDYDDQYETNDSGKDEPQSTTSTTALGERLL